MKIAYFDSSLFMSILLEEDRELEAKSIWESYSIRISSILLKIESNISLLKFYKLNKYKFGATWFNEKKILRKKLLNEIFLNDITEDFANTMEQNDSLSKCKSLDAIHIATALNAQSNPNNKNVVLCSFDNNMLALAKELGFETV